MYPEEIDPDTFFFKKLFLINTVCSLMLHQSAKTFFVAADAAVDLGVILCLHRVHCFPVRLRWYLPVKSHRRE